MQDRDTGSLGGRGDGQELTICVPCPQEQEYFPAMLLGHLSPPFEQAREGVARRVRRAVARRVGFMVVGGDGLVLLGLNLRVGK